MIAEIKGKIGEENTGSIELREDELTGNFFGSLRYIPFNKGMKKILKNSIRPPELQAMIDEVDEIYWADNLFLWERVRESGGGIAELDVRMDFPGIVIGIEVKYRSGLSSEDRKDDEDISAENSKNQLSREARVLCSVGFGKKKLLLLLCDELSGKKTIENVKMPDGVAIGYFSWQEVLVQLRKLTDINGDLNDFERLVILDLVSLLEKKGFSRFFDFKFDMPDVSDTQYWHFNMPIWNSKFNFKFDNTVEDKYYEFRGEHI